jgi:hypothetical protein
LEVVLHNPMAKSGGRTVGGEKSGSTARCVTVRELYTRTGEPFVSRPLRCAKRETQDLSVLVTRGARARGARARGPRPEARGASARVSEVRGPRLRRERPVTALGLCHTRSGQQILPGIHLVLVMMTH